MEDLKILKTTSQLELIEGNWKPHVAFTVEGVTMDDLWEKFAIKAGVIIDYKKMDNLGVLYLRDPAGNFVEVVIEH